MMKIIGLFFSLCVFTSHGQIDELRRAQDVRKAQFTRDENANMSPKTTYVDPFIGTGGHGHTYPGAAAPFGMMQLSPDTRHDGWDGCSGYHYSDSTIYGFSHTHLSGTGVPDYCDLLIVPQTGKARTEPGYLTPDGYGARFSHETENADPGYYDVKLLDQNIDVRLTVTERCGMHEYTFNNPKGNRYVLIDLDHRDRILDSKLDVVDQHTIQGYRVSESWASKQHFYFYIKSDVSFKKTKIITKDGRHKLLITFPKGTTKVTLKVGMSAVDEAGAKRNLETEMPDWNFDALRNAVRVKWEQELNRISISSTNRETLITFYTALYHSFLAPNLFSDVDGRYRGRDNQLHALAKADQRQYTVFSLWDTYRATHPLFTLTQQERTVDFMETFQRQFEQGGDLPVWELAGNETECMIGYHSVSVLADALLKGIGGELDRKTLLDQMIATSNFDEFGKVGYAQNGFIDIGNEPESVSKTLEYAYDDFCIAKLLESEGTLPEIEEIYQERSMNFINVFDPSTKFMRGRRSGQWFSPFDPAEVNFNYTEANSWQYSLYAPHAVGVLTDLLGGKDSLELWLDRLFTTESSLSGRHQVDITGLIGQYAHGNEPSHHIAYLYNYTNAPHKTQLYVDRILKEMYSIQPDGLSGNEDCGQMSSWYVLSSMGLYQIAPGNPYYEIGRPVVDKASIKLENGKQFTIKCINNATENLYIQNVTLNGKQIDQHYISHEAIMAGGLLEFTMGSTPNLNRSLLKHSPTISELPERFVSVPYIEQEARVFDESMEITLKSALPSEEIFYTLDGTIPNRTSNRFTDPITIRANTHLKAVSYNGSNQSSVISNSFLKRDNTISVKLFSEYANQYAAGGEFSLIDGIIGGNEFRTGDWQGYWAQDVVAEISFMGGKSLSEIGIGCLSDMKSWVFLPKEVVFEGTVDGTSYEVIGVQPLSTETEQEMTPHKVDVKVKVDASKMYKTIRITVKNSGKCPTWHLGNGNDTWLFVDEIVYK